MYCGKCGANIPDNVTFCPACGFQVKKCPDSPSRVHTDPGPEPGHAFIPPKPRRPGKWIIPIAALCLVAASLVGLAAIGRNSRMKRGHSDSWDEDSIVEDWDEDSGKKTAPKSDRNIPSVRFPEVPEVELLNWSKVKEADPEDFEYEVVEANISYETEEEVPVICLTGYLGADPIVKIPEKIDGKPVSQITSTAFQGRSTITHVYLPDSFSNRDLFGMEAVSIFENCTSLRQVSMPNMDISDRMFANCTALESVTFRQRGDESYNRIGNYAFENCSSLACLELPESYRSLAGNVFENCTGLKYISAPCVTSFYQEVFKGCTSLEVLSAPMAYNFGELLFRDCERLETLLINKYLYDDAYMKPVSVFGGPALKEVLFADIQFRDNAVGSFSTEDHIIYYTGEYKDNADTVSLIRCLPGYSRDTLVLRDDTTDILSRSVVSANIKSVTLPASVKRIESNPFVLCEFLESVSLEPGTELELVDGTVCNSCPALTTLDFSNDQGTTEYTVKGYECPSLETVKYPNR